MLNIQTTVIKILTQWSIMNNLRRQFLNKVITLIPTQMTVESENKGQEFLNELKNFSPNVKGYVINQDNKWLVKLTEK